MASTTGFSDEKLENLSKTTLKLRKGKHWSWFLEKPNDVQPSSTFNDSIPFIPSIGPTNKRIVKIPSNWKLVPLKISDKPSSTVTSNAGLNIDASGRVKAILLCPVLIC